MRLGKFSFGVVDWENPVLLEEYYPEDLPADWRLDFYANEYHVVVVPAAKWQGADERQLQSWHDDAEDLLQFIFESGDESKYPLIRSIFADSSLGFSDLPPPSSQGFQFTQMSLGGDGIGLVILDLEAGNNSHLKELKKHLEALIRTGDDTQRYIFVVRSKQHQTETIASVQILLELMGYSV